MGKSLDYIGYVKLPVCLEEWEWHEAEMDGYRCQIITDIKQKDHNPKE
ncbi:hypothetical protein [Niabella ginsengisoli]|uniref:Uncharacterized protein n=1 Tax=Niabella ginsengisoli TaxID=522298 RepID=A0ABS9SKK8_9BACT|nr:hypothetical protein [Niabella ginsengisoli]MCH5598840.1 hypothetical protein [Niabella ginsengisoli]